MSPYINVNKLYGDVYLLIHTKPSATTKANLYRHGTQYLNKHYPGLNNIIQKDMVGKYISLT